MSFASQSELPQPLAALAHLTQWHANTSGQPLEVRFEVAAGNIESVSCLVTGSYTASAPADYVRSATVAVYELVRGGHFEGAYSVRINSVPGGQTVVKQMPQATPAVEEVAPEPAQPAAPVSHDGLQLRAALLARGHNSGYTADEVAAEEKRRGITYTPELKFYRALVRNGVVAERGTHSVIASTNVADFGASTLDAMPWRAPQSTDGTVQAVLHHNLWIEIANDPDYLYAIDLAPGAQGVQGQVLARRRDETSVPVRVAMSLAQFIAGDFTDSPTASTPAPAAQQVAPVTSLAQTVAWAGQVEPSALPGFLGWTLAPTAERYARILREIAPDAVVEADEPSEDTEAQQSTEVAEAGAEQVEGTPVSTSPAPEGNVTAEGTGTDAEAGTTATESSAPESSTAKTSTSETPAQDEAGEKNTTGENGSAPGAGSPGSAEQNPAPVTASSSVTSLFAAGSQPPQPQDDDLDDVDPGVAKAPSSPEQKNIADSIATLAFGSQEERDKYREVDTENMPSIASRVKKVSLADAPQQPAPAQRQQDGGGVFAALRKFFIG